MVMLSVTVLSAKLVYLLLMEALQLSENQSLLCKILIKAAFLFLKIVSLEKFTTVGDHSKESLTNSMLV